MRLSDLEAALPGGQPVTFGMPPGVEWSREQVTYDGTTITHGELVGTPTRLLDEGHIYVMKPSAVVAALAQDLVPDPTGIVAWRVKQTVSAVASQVLKLLDYIPLVYEVGPPQGGPRMPRPAHARVTFSGVFGAASAPIEIWSWGLTFRDKPDHGGTTQALADKANALYKTLVNPLMGTGVVKTKCRVAFLGDGAHVNELETGYDQADNVEVVTGGQATTQVLPLQTALVISFYTPRPGAKGRGRCFLPAAGLSVYGNYCFDVDTVLARASAVKGLAEGMENATGGPSLGAHCVVSSSNFATDVTSYRVGAVPDTMRSRRNALKEQYAIVAP